MLRYLTWSTPVAIICTEGSLIAFELQTKQLKQQRSHSKRRSIALARRGQGEGRGARGEGRWPKIKVNVSYSVALQPKVLWPHFLNGCTARNFVLLPAASTWLVFPPTKTQLLLILAPPHPALVLYSFGLFHFRTLKYS